MQKEWEGGSKRGFSLSIFLELKFQNIYPKIGWIFVSEV